MSKVRNGTSRAEIVAFLDEFVHALLDEVKWPWPDPSNTPATALKGKGAEQAEEEIEEDEG